MKLSETETLPISLERHRFCCGSRVQFVVLSLQSQPARPSSRIFPCSAPAAFAVINHMHKTALLTQNSITSIQRLHTYWICQTEAMQHNILRKLRACYSVKTVPLSLTRFRAGNVRYATSRRQIDKFKTSIFLLSIRKLQYRPGLWSRTG